MYKVVESDYVTIIIIFYILAVIINYFVIVD